MVTQTPIRHKTNEQEAPEPIRVIKWVNGRYQTVTLTPEMVEQSKRRAAFVAMFDPCGVE